MKYLLTIVVCLSFTIHAMEMELPNHPRITVVNPSYKTVINFLNASNLQIKQYEKKKLFATVRLYMLFQER